MSELEAGSAAPPPSQTELDKAPAVVAAPAAAEGQKDEEHVDANDYSRFEDISDSDDELDGGAPDKAALISAGERLQQAGTAKLEGNDMIKAQDFAGAVEKYRTGIKALGELQKCKPSATTAEEAEARDLRLSLHLNQAMAELKLEHWKAATTAASEALKFDAANVKALFRRGVANSRSGNLEAAKRDLARVVELDQANGAGKRELALVKKKIQEHKAKSKKSFANLFERAGGVYDDREREKEEKAAKKRREEEALQQAYDEEKGRREEAGEAEISFKDWKEQKEAAEKKAKEEEEAKAKEQRKKEREARRKERREEKEELDLDEDDASIMKELHRGYCYFRRNQSAEEKSLIGDIAPKKVGGGDGPSTPSGHGAPSMGAASPASASPGSASAWNSDGTTWEEKDCSVWARDTLETMLQRVTVAGEDHQGASVSAKVTKVSKVDGDASVAVVRGKARYLFDLSAEVDYEIELEEQGAASGKKYRGKITLVDIANDALDDMEVAVVPKGAAVPPNHKPQVDAVMQDLRNEIKAKCIPEFAAAFQSSQ